MFTKLVSKKNDTSLQLLRNKLLLIAQRKKTVAWYFYKRIIIHDLIYTCRDFVAAVWGRQNQPFIVEFENSLAGQRALTKQIVGVLLKSEEEEFYTNKSRCNSKQHVSMDLKEMSARQNFIKAKGMLVQGEFHSIMAKLKNLKGSSIIVGRRVTRRKVCQ